MLKRIKKEKNNTEAERHNDSGKNKEMPVFNFVYSFLCVKFLLLFSAFSASL